MRNGVIWAVLFAASIGGFAVLERGGRRAESVTKEPYATFLSESAPA